MTSKRQNGSNNRTLFEQESPPAWTQEAYRPPCSKYSLCCPNLVPPPARVPPQPGYPPARVPPLARVPPSQGTPPWPGYPPGQGTPPAGPGRVQPPPPDCPMAFWEMLQSIMGYGYPPPRCEQTENITFPHPSDAGGNNFSDDCHGSDILNFFEQSYSITFLPHSSMHSSKSYLLTSSSEN